jgi:hypothetical protein
MTSNTKYPRVTVGYENQDGVWVNESGGKGSVVYITNTDTVTGEFSYVMVLKDAVFSTFVRENSTGSITGQELPAGILLVGPVTEIKLTSGIVAAYV